MHYMLTLLFWNDGLLGGHVTAVCKSSSALYHFRHFTQNWQNLLYVNVQFVKRKAYLYLIEVFMYVVPNHAQ